MLFIHNDRAEIFNRCEHGGTGADDDFNFGESDFEEQLQPQLPDFGGEPVALPSTKGKKVSASSVILTFVVVPLFVAGAMAVLFVRRRRATIGS